MSHIRLQPPDAFNFRNPNDWPRWKKRFEQFRVASNLSRDPEDRQISTLLYCLGEEAENVLTSTGISEDDRKKYMTQFYCNLTSFSKYGGMLYLKELFSTEEISNRGNLWNNTSLNYTNWQKPVSMER